jgi:pimeloyl-ACP methyl ester carboxylesterase
MDRNMARLARQRFCLSGGTELAFVTAGHQANPAVLLIHGYPSSANTFRDVVPVLAEAAYVIAPDLPGYGESDLLAKPTFAAFGEALIELLDHLKVGPRHIYLHDWGAPVGFHIAMAAPDLVLGLIIQNGNAHRTGFSSQWEPTQAFWANPTPETEAKSFTFFTLEATRDQYIGGVPPDVAARISPDGWEEDWRVMNLPGHRNLQRALLLDYGQSYVARFNEIDEYLAQRQPPALLIWGRHDIFFDIAEVLSWMTALPRMEAHVFDSGHFMLETHAAPAASLMADFVKRRGLTPPA